MSAVSFGTLLPNAMAVATAQAEPTKGVWRGSYHIDDDRAKVGRPFGDGSVEQSLGAIEEIVKTAKAWTKHFKPSGKAHQLTLNMIATLEATLRTHMDFKTGACEATYEMIMAATGFARATVIRHLKALRTLGWFDWVRRSTSANGRNEQTANSYFFEISRLPFEAQVLMRQLLKKRGIALNAHADRHGSGPVPNKAQRLAERIAKGLACAKDFVRTRRQKMALMNEAAFVRAEMEHFGEVSPSLWASMRHPNNPVAQEAYNRRMGILPLDLGSINLVPHSSLTEQE